MRRSLCWLLAAAVASAVANPLSGQTPGPAGSIDAPRVEPVETLRVEPHAGSPPAQEVEARAWVSKTALWVGDHVTFTVELACAPNVDILTDDLAKEKLRLDGLEMIAAETERSAQNPEGVTYRVRYELATYEVGAPSLGIGELTVRYYVRRPGQRVEDAAPAGQIRIPGAQLAWRSTIPDEAPALGLRDARPPADLPVALAIARPLGLGLIVLTAAPVVLWGASLVRRARPRRVRRRRREAQTLMRSTLDELQALDVSAAASRREAYGRLDALLRQLAANAAGISAQALTPPEIVERLRANGSALPAETVGALLEECEQARYGPPSRLPSAERLREAIATTEQLVSGATR